MRQDHTLHTVRRAAPSSACLLTAHGEALLPALASQRPTLLGVIHRHTPPTRLGDDRDRPSVVGWDGAGFEI